MSESQHNRQRACERAYHEFIGPAIGTFFGSITFHVHDGHCPQVEFKESIKLSEKRKYKPQQQ